MAHRGDSVTLPHIKFLWCVVKKFANELCSTQISSMKMLTISSGGLMLLPAISRLHVSTVLYQSCAFLYYGCMYIFAVEGTSILFRIIEFHRLFFCCGGTGHH